MSSVGTLGQRQCRSERGTWRVVLPAVVMLVVIAGSQATAQKRPYPIFTLDHLDSTMKLVGRNFAGANASLAGHDIETAKARFTRTREQLAISITFWRHQEKDDAIRMLRDTIVTLDELDTALAGDVDATAARALASEVDAACESCHAAYREQDPTTKAYRLKRDSDIL